MSTTTNSSQKTRILQSSEEFASILPEWKELFRRSPDATPFQHPDWLMAWVAAFQPRELVGIEIRESGRLIGFAPLLIYHRNGERVLAFAGGGVSDYLGVLAEAGRDSLVAADIVACVQEISGWDTLDLTDLHPNSFLLRCPSLKPYRREHDLCFVLSLPATSDELQESLSKRQWANLRNARSRTHRQGEAVVETAAPATAGAFLNDLFRLHASRWQELGQRGVLGDRQVQEFHQAVAPKLIETGMLRVYRMALDERTLAIIYCFFHRQIVYCYLQGFEPEARHLSPGTQLMFSVIEDSVQCGMRCFDFLRGKEPYKLHWHPRAEPTYRIEIPRRQMANGMARTA